MACGCENPAQEDRTPIVCNATDMAWLVSEGRVLASAEVAPDRKARTRGLLGREDLDGALILDPCRWVHTLGMRFAIDVAYVGAEGVVVKTVQMRRRRLGVPVFGARYVIEASAGAFARWGLRVGDPIEIRGDHHESAPDQSTRPDTSAADDTQRHGPAAGGSSDAARARTPDSTERDRRRGDATDPRPDRDSGDSRRIAVLAASR